jgi:phosphopantothenoylcysteine decarboxylase/phosphopantothenate--cysteine ligase
LLAAPAMNLQMWANPATQRNMKQLGADGVTILGPASGDQACGEVGMGRMLEAEEIFEEVEAFFQPKLLAGKRVLVTAGPTVEPIDTVRGITNTSSGKMGYAVARAARDAGAAVTLVSGPTALAAPRGLERIDVSSAREMYDAVMARVAKTDVFIAVAAVADYRPKEAKRHKVKKGAGEMTLELELNPDILGSVAARRNAPFCVGFAAETENLEAYADAKRRSKKVPLLAANLAQHAFGADDNQLILFDDKGKHELARAPKSALARALVAHIAKLLQKK